MTVFSKLVPAALTAYGTQSLFAAIFVPQKNETYYDFCGALGWLSTGFVSLYYPVLRESFFQGRWIGFPPLSSFGPRQVLLTAALGIWSARLGYFLGSRAIKAGGDSRFDEIKDQPARFSVFWFGQATWIMTVGLPVYLANTLPPSLSPAFGVRDYLALGLLTGSFLLEVIADHQKTAWRRAKQNKEHDEKFITSGLWSISRHPNYLGEVGIWMGMWALASKSLQSPYFPRGTVALGALSPLFAWYLLTRVSGVPPLEASGNKKFGDDPKWQEYKRTVPVFWPWGNKG